MRSIDARSNEWWHETIHTAYGHRVTLLTCNYGECKFKARAKLYNIAERRMLHHIAVAHRGQLTFKYPAPKRNDPPPF